MRTYKELSAILESFSAKQALEHLGGANAVERKLGATSLTYNPKELIIKFKPKNKKINTLRISINSNDLYDIDFVHFQDKSSQPNWGAFTSVQKETDIFVDDLISTINKVTGHKL